MNASADRITFHEANGLWQSIQNAGKKDWAKKSRAVAYQLYAYEVAFRRLRELIQKGASEKELLGVIDTAMGPAAQTAKEAES